MLVSDNVVSVPGLSLQGLIVIFLMSFVVSVGSAHADVAAGKVALASGDYTEARRQFLLSKNDPESLFYIATMYEKGHGVRQNYSQVWLWFNKAATLGHQPSVLKVASMHYDGVGIPQSYAKAAKWYEIASKAGEVEAQARYGEMLSKGVGVPRNIHEAVNWLFLAAEKGHAGARSNLNTLYLRGIISRSQSINGHQGKSKKSS